MSDEFISFEDALSELQLPKDDLKRLVSESEIRAFRDKGETIFKKEDVRALKEALSHQPIIVPSGEGKEMPLEVEAGKPVEEGFEETVLNIEGLSEIDLGEDMTAGPAVEEVERPEVPAPEETFATIEEPGTEPAARMEDEKELRDTIRMDETAVPEEEETFVLSESDLGDETESLELLDDTSTVLEDEGARAAYVAPGVPRAGFQPSGLAIGEGAPADKLTVALLAVTIVVMVFGLFASLGLLLQQSNAILDLFRG